MSEEHIRAPGVGPALGGAGSPCPEVPLGSKKWKVGWPTQEAKARHELLVAQFHEESLDARRGIYAPAKFARKQRELELQLGAGEHCVGGDLWLAVADGPAWNVVLLTSLLREHHPEATFDDARALWRTEPRKVRIALALVIPPFVEVLLTEAPVSRDEKALKVLEMVAHLLQLAGIRPDPEMSETDATPTDSPVAPTG